MNTNDVICYLNGFFTNSYDSTIILNQYQKHCILTVIENSVYDGYTSWIIDHMYKHIQEESNLDCAHWGTYVRTQYVMLRKLTSAQVIHLLEGFLDNKLTTTQPYQNGLVLFTYDEAFYYLEQIEKCDDLGMVLKEFCEILYEFINGASYDDELNITEPIVTLFN